MTRTQNSFFNMITSLGASLLTVSLSFVTRTVFIKYLGTGFLGVEGLFSNILSLLSLTELGIGYAIIFKLYRPIAENDRSRILVLLKLYRQVYWVIGAVIVTLGLILIPLLPHLVKDYERFAELGLRAGAVFIVYILNTASSYWFFAYKSSFVRANQKAYILTTVGYAISVARSLCQILALVLFHSFMLYILVQLLFTIITGIIGSLICDRYYPFARGKTRESISREERRDFARDCGSLLLYNVHNVVINASDNVVLSAMVGLETVGLYANYLSVKMALRTLLDGVMDSLKASLGSLYTTDNPDWSRLMFRTVNFLMVWMYGVGAIGLALLLDDFITLWLGSDYVVNSWVFQGSVIATPLALFVGIEMYIIGYRELLSTYREALGLFQQMKYRPLLSVLINLAVVIPGIYYWGILGCVVSTIVAGLTTNMIFDPIIIYRHALKQPVGPYFLRNLLYVIVVAAAGGMSWWVCSLIPLTGIPGFVVHGLFCVFIPSCMFILCFHRTTEFRTLLNSAKELLSRTGGHA